MSTTDSAEKNSATASYRKVIGKTDELGTFVWSMPRPNTFPHDRTTVRRWYPHGSTVWYEIPGRDATSDDLVNPHGALAFALGLSVGLLECAWSGDAFAPDV